MDPRRTPSRPRLVPHQVRANAGVSAALVGGIVVLGITTALLASAALFLGAPAEIPEVAAPAEPAEPKDEIPPSRAEAPPELELPGDPLLDVDGGTGEADTRAVIASVVKKSQGRIQSCLESALLDRPALAGRVAIGWSIVAGRVTQASVVSNDTGSDALGACMTGAVRGFRFPESVTAEVAEFPWVVSGR